MLYQAEKSRALRKQAGILLLCVLAVAPLPGCGSRDEEANYPEPGSMTVVSATKLDESKSPNLLLNGSFEEYYAGASQPSGKFTVPPEDSRFTKISRSEQASDGSIAIKQHWDRRDWTTPLAERFSVSAPIEPQTTYRVEIDASVLTKSAPFLAVYLATDDGAPEAVGAMRVTATDTYDSYGISFDSGQHTTVLLVSAGPNLLSEYPCDVLWDNFRLHKGFRTAKSPAKPAGENAQLIENGSFNEWVPGEPVPKGFAGPEGGSVPYILFQSDQGTERELVAHQFWQKTDADLGTWKLFHTRVNGLEPHKAYTFTFDANTLGTAGGRIVIYSLGAQDKIQDALGTESIVAGTEFTTYTIHFTLDDAQDIVIATKGPTEDSAYPCRTFWDNWSLTRDN